MYGTLVPVITKVGKAQGRDAIYLESIHFINEATVELKGFFTGGLCSELAEDTDQNYSIVFRGLRFFKIVELDFNELPYESSFDQVMNSSLLTRFLEIDKVMHNAIDPRLHHYIFRTYDSIFEIVCTKFELTT